MKYGNAVNNFGLYQANTMPKLHEGQIGSIQDEIILYVPIFKFHFVIIDTASNRRTNSMQQVHPERIMHPQIVRKQVAFYGTCRFITMFTPARLLSLSSAKCIWSTIFIPIL